MSEQIVSTTNKGIKAHHNLCIKIESTHLAKSRSRDNDDSGRLEETKSIECIRCFVSGFSSLNCLLCQTDLREQVHCSFSLVASNSLKFTECILQCL